MTGGLAMGFNPRRIALWVVVGTLVIAGIVYAFRPQPVPVDLAEVTVGPLEVTIEAEGRTRMRDTYQVFAPITGFALRSPVEVGDPVHEAETVIASIRPAEPGLLDARARQQAEAAVTEAEAALRLAEINITRAVADLDYARSQYERTRALAERGTIAQRMLDDAALLHETREAALEAARSERDMHEATLARMRAQLIGPAAQVDGDGTGACCAEITAPITGVVLDVTEVSARLVQAGEPLVEIGRPEDLEIEVELLSSDAVRVPSGAEAYVERWGGEAVLAAQVRRIEPSAFTRVSALGIEEQRVRVILDFLAAREERPRLGNAYRVFLRIVEWREEAVVQVPVSALFRTGDAWTVFRVVDGRAEPATVVIGRRNQAQAQVISGLEPGDRVISHPSDRVEAGVRVADRAALETGISD
jgi:HlyD family secretion protein